MRKLHQHSNASSNLSSQFTIEGSFDDFLLDTGQEIEDVHIFGGQTPVKRLENLNVCRENEFFSQVLNDQIRSS